MARTDEELLGIAAVAAELGCSPSLVRHLEATGIIPPARRMAGRGVRIWSRQEVEAIRAIRQGRGAAVA